VRGSKRRFRPERLTEAREARDLTKTALADLIGRNNAASITHYEKGRHEPPADVLGDMAKALGVPVGFFFEPPRRTLRGPTFFRSMAAATKRARTRASRRIDWAWDVLRFVEDLVDIAPVDIPPPPDKPWESLTREDVERAAAGLRRHWGLGDGPIPNVVWLVERYGCVVVRDAIGSKHLDAHASWCGPRPIIILNSDKKSAVRSRFDCAHELGHLILHRDVPESIIRSSTYLKQIEKQANAFASAFLMPAETFAQEMGAVTLEAMLALKPRWRVSVAAQLKRCQALRLVSPSRATSLWKARSARGWTKQEPFDDELFPEHPRTFERAFGMISDHGLASRDAVLAATQLPARDIERLAGLGDGFLDGEPTRVYAIGPRLG